jgi:hypothetical protein
MDPDERLIGTLGAELHRSLAEMHLDPAARERLQHRLASATSLPWWQRSPWVPATGWRRAAAAGIAACAVAAAVATPLLTAHRSSPRGAPQYLVVIPPRAGANRVPSGTAAPATCSNAPPRLSVTPRQVTLSPAQQADFYVTEIGGACVPTVTVSGPSRASLAVTLRPYERLPSVAAGTSASYLLTWAGEGISAGAAPGAVPGRALKPGSYRVTLEIPGTRARASISIRVS